MFTRRLFVDVGGDSAPPLPDVDTNLWSTTEADEGGFYDTFDVVIPAGVNVVYVGGGINGSIVGEPCYCSMYSNFISASGEDSAGATNYIGVIYANERSSETMFNRRLLFNGAGG